MMTAMLETSKVMMEAVHVMKKNQDIMIGALTKTSTTHFIDNFEEAVCVNYTENKLDGKRAIVDSGAPIIIS